MPTTTNNDPWTLMQQILGRQGATIPGGTPAYGATPTLPGAGGQYVPPGSPVARTNGAIQQAGNTPMQSPLTNASGAPPMQTAQNTTSEASPYNTPPMTSPLTGAAGATGATGDVTGDPGSPLPALSGAGDVWPNTGGTEASASGEFNVDLPGLPSGREDLAQLLTMQQLNQQQGNPMLDLLQGLSVQNLGGPFGLTPSEEQLAYGRGESMLKASEAEQQRATLEDMNRRGILTSGITVDQLQKGIAGGQLARQNLLSDLLISNAQNQQSQRNAALGTAGSMYGVGEAGKQQNFGNLMGLLGNAQGWQGQQFGQQQQVYNDSLNNYYKQVQLESALNSNARAEEMQPYQLLMQLAGLGESETGGLGSAGNLALGAQGQALANQDTGTDWGGVIGSILPSLLALLL